jgi:hypothetical protein
MPSNAITWIQIGNSFWIVATAIFGLLFLLYILDAIVIYESRSYAVQKQTRLKYLRHESVFEHLRLVCARITHPRASSFGRFIEVLAVLLAFVQYCIYIYSTYVATLNATVLILTCFCTTFFLLRILLRILVHEPGERINVVLTFDAIIDVSCSISSIFPFTTYIGSSFTFCFLRPINLYYSYCNIDGVTTYTLHRYQCSRVQRLLMLIALIIFSFLAAFAGTISTLENVGNLNGWDVIVSNSFSAFNSFFFAITTLATVGYGDIVPNTFFGRLFTSLYIILGICLSASIVNSLLSVLQLQARLIGDEYILNEGKRPTLLFIGSPSARQIEELLLELFPCSAFGSRLNFHVVILLDKDHFHKSMASHFHNHPTLSGRVTYIRGSVGERLSLERAGAMSTDCYAAFVLQKRLARDDSVNLLRMLALRRFCPQLPIYMTLCNSNNTQIALDSGVSPHNLFVTDAFRHGLLASNALTPGVSTLLINLWSTPIVPPISRPNSPWICEYTEGMNQQLVEIKVPRWLVGRSLKEACFLLFLAPILRNSQENIQFVNVESLVSSLSSHFPLTNSEGAVVIAIKQRAPNRTSLIHCNLSSIQRLRRNDSLFIITRDTSLLGTDVIKIGANILPINEDEDVLVNEDVTTESRPLSSSPTSVEQEIDSDSSLSLTALDRFPSILLPPPITIRGHIIVITNTWLDSLALFLIPYRLSSSKPVVILSSSNPPTSSWLHGLHRSMHQRGVSSEDLYFVQGNVRNTHDKDLCRLSEASTVIIITSAQPEPKIYLEANANVGLFQDLFSREEVLQGIESAEIEVDTDAILATIHLEHYASLSIVTEVASSKSHLLLGSAEKGIDNSNITRPRRRGRATLSTSDARRLAFRTGRSTRELQHSNTYSQQPRSSHEESMTESAESSSDSDPDDTVRRRRSYHIPQITVPTTVTSPQLLSPSSSESEPIDVTPLRLSSRYASGQLLPSQSFNTLLVQSLFNPSLLRLIKLFAENDSIRIISISIPNHLLINPPLTFATVFIDMLRNKQQITLGLYRSNLVHKSPLPYVFTNPPMNTILHSKDLLFVCCMFLGQNVY